MTNEDVVAVHLPRHLADIFLSQAKSWVSVEHHAEVTSHLEERVNDLEVILKKLVDASFCEDQLEAQNALIEVVELAVSALEEGL